MAKKDQMTKFLRRSLQFKLRSFLLILAIVCIWLGWYSVRVQQQREAVDWVLKNGGAVRYDYEYQGQKFIPDSQPSVPKWLLDTLGVDYFSAVTWVELSNMSKQVSDVTPLASLAKLKKLRLFNTQVNDVTPLAGLTNLEILVLSDTQVSNVTPLAGLTNLEFLMLDDTQISDLKPLAGLANLAFLTLHDTQISNLAPLAGLANLDVLALNDTQVSDVAPLAGLANLKELWLSNTQASEEDIEKLKQALPNCVVESVDEYPFFGDN